MCLSCHCLGKQCLTCTGRSHQKRSLGQPGTDLGIFPRIMQKVHNFYQGLFRFILSCHILKCDARFFLHIGLGITLAHAHGPAFAAHPSKQQTQQSPH